MKAFFVSDLHLKGPNDPNTDIFRSFLISLIEESDKGGDERPTHLFLVGDIFDLWIGDHEYFVKAFSEIIDPISRLSEQGVEVHFFEGNHDLHLDPYWSRRIGITVHTEAEYFELGPWAVRVEHGDQMNPDDKGYLFLRWFLRTWIMRMIALRLPSALVAAIGERASGLSRNYTSTAKGLSSEKMSRIIRAHAERAHRDRAFDFLISGHVHVKDEQELRVEDGGIAKSINLGSWFDTPKALVLTSERAEFLSLV